MIVFYFEIIAELSLKSAKIFSMPLLIVSLSLVTTFYIFTVNHYSCFFSLHIMLQYKSPHPQELFETSPSIEPSLPGNYFSSPSLIPLMIILYHKISFSCLFLPFITFSFIICCLHIR